MLILKNPQTGKELTISDELGKDFFGADSGQFICLPAGEVQMRSKNAVKIDVRKHIKTCVARMGGVGDLIMLSSGLRELQRRRESVTVATTKANRPLMELMGFQTIDIEDLSFYAFDELIDLRFTVEPPELGSHCKGTWDSYTMDDRSDAFDKLLGVYPCPKRFELSVPEIKIPLPLRYVLIVGAIDAPARSIPPEYVKDLCSMIVERLRVEIILCGKTQQWNHSLQYFSLPKMSNLIDSTTIAEMISLCASADLVVTPDTGILHIAGALGKKCIGLFGAIHPRTRISYYQSVKALYAHGEMSCIPCGDIHPCLNDPKDGAPCLNLLSPKVIFEAVKEVL